MVRLVAFLTSLLIAGVAVADRAPAADAADGAGIEFFERRIRPLLIEACHECHADNGQKVRGGLRLDSRAAMIAGGESGPALTPGDPAKSRLIEAVSYRNASMQMPPKRKLTDAQIADLTQWVRLGAPWPDERTGQATKTPAEGEPDFYASRRREHWAWQPVRKQEPPQVRNEAWPRNDIDRFILAKLETKGLSPSPQADPRTLIRRVTFDLTGLPPTAEEVQAFIKDQSPDAWTKLVDRLLASPQYGERWARHWLDVVRYADSKDSRGMGGDADIPFAWRYRDWVVDAFNRDLPYDRFITQQIAGDLIGDGSEFKVQSSELKGHDPEHTSVVPSTQNSEPGTQNFSSLIATTLLAIGHWDAGDSDKRKMMTDIVDDQIDVISRGFLGVTIACARCHDHKFDPVTTRDYYALAGFFFSSHVVPGPGDPTAISPMLKLPLMTQEQIAAIDAAKRRVEELKTKINADIDARRREVITRELGRIRQYLTAVDELHHSPRRDDPAMLGVIAAKHSVHAAILKRLVRYVGLTGAGGTLPGLFTTKLSEVGRQPHVSGWGEPAMPMIIANAGAAPVKILTYTLPPRSLSMHPSPSKQVALGWRSKFNGVVSVTGSAADADDACGNGFGWAILHQRKGVVTRLASGVTGNGGQANFEKDAQAARLTGVQVEAGDLISLVIDAAGRNHVCDTTAVRFTLKESAGARREWDVTGDVVDSITASNPHADAHGHRDVWHFYAIREDGEEADAKLPPGSLLARWIELITAADRDSSVEVRNSRTELETAIVKLAVSGIKPPAGASPADVALHKDLTTPDSPLWSTIDLPAYSETDRTALDAMRDEMPAQVKLATSRIDYTQGIREGGVPGSEHAGVRDARIHVRGRYDRLGDSVPRGFPSLLTDQPQAVIKSGSGRLELARWIASPRNPMTARVMVNRLWQHHFGQGIVATPDNFGHLGTPPSHPELLDHLAAQFIEQGWSLKAMHRMIVLSATYQQASSPAPGTRNPASALLDPSNTLLWRQNRRRLDAEQMRDAMLAVADRLDRSDKLAAGPGVGDLLSPRRSIYLLAVRSDRTTYRMLFDGADPTASIHVRNESTIAPQALFLLNHPFALDIARSLADRVQKEAKGDDRDKMNWLHERLFSRPATDAELAIGLKFLGGDERDRAAGWRAYAQVLLCANEFMYVD